VFTGVPQETQGTKVVDGSGEGLFYPTISGLDADTTHYFKAFATNTAGTSYGDLLNFKTALDTPTASGMYALPPFKV
jgi:hypothetical protein